NVDTASICFPARDTRREALVGVRYTGVMLFLEFVFYGIGSRVATKPELFNELLAFFIGLQRFICGAFFVRNNVGDVFVEPFPQCATSGFLFTGLFGSLGLFPVVFLCVFLLGLILFLSSGPRRSSEEKQGSEGDENPSSAHKTPRVRLVNMHKLLTLVS